MNFEELVDIAHKELHSSFSSVIAEVHFDSRQIVTPNLEDVFVAIAGKNHDGNKFVEEAFAKGVRQFILERKPSEQVLASSNVLVVKNTLHALQAIATAHRSKFSIPVIGITGSNGKTIVKEWISTLLQSRFAIIKNPGSYNSQLGVALSVLNINQNHSLGIFEAGISMCGEMDLLQKIIQPTIGIFTNIGSAHEEGFQNTEEKINEKLQLFVGVKTLIYNDWDALVADSIESMPQVGRNLICWGSESPYKIIFKGNMVEIDALNRKFNVEIPFLDQASQENLGHTIALMLHLGFEGDEIRTGIPLLHGVSMRLTVLKGVKDSVLVDDSYTNDIVGLQSALNFTSHQKPALPILLILSDVAQSNSPSTYQEIARIITKYKVSEVIGVGKDIRALQNLLTIPVSLYSDTESLLAELSNYPRRPSRILVKGARSFRLEQVVNTLSLKIHATRLELNMNNMVHNLNFYRSKLSSDTKIMVMVKALAYGTDSTEVARLLEYHGVNYLGVAYVDEGIELRKRGIHIPIMVMNPTIQSYAKLKEYQLEPEIFSIQQLQAYGKIQNMPPIHLKVDTGMHRLGFDESEIHAIANEIIESNITVATVFSHLAVADNESQREFTENQISIFHHMASQIVKLINQAPMLHICNSSGIVLYPEAHFDMVRLGIGLHGIDPTKAFSNKLLPVSKLVSTVSQVKTIKQGETVGYNRSAVIKKDTQIATVAIGYADGFKRTLGNGHAEVWINNHRAKTLGDVCMDMIMVDVEGMGVKEGDEVELFGPNITLEEFARSANTISYEILTSISQRVRRVYVYE